MSRIMRRRRAKREENSKTAQEKDLQILKREREESRKRIEKKNSTKVSSTNPLKKKSEDLVSKPRRSKYKDLV
jgi:hypothetical protein